jgi:hypothetical protein
MRAILSLMLIIAPAGAIAADAVERTPTQFLGEWNSVPAQCGTGDNDSALRIAPNHIHFYESDGPLKAIVVHGRYEIALIAELSGEGSTWLTSMQFKLSPSENELIYTHASGKQFVRFRCPARS